MFYPEKIIELGIIFLLIYTPLAVGGGSQFSITLLELVSGILLIVWFTKLFSQRKRTFRHRRKKGKKPRQEHRRKMYRLQFIFPPFTWIICVFCLLIVLQCLPLPGLLVKTLSPATYRLYAEGATHTISTLPNWLSLSVYTNATETEFYQFLAYAALFFVIINNIQSSKQIKRLVYIIIAVGFLEAIYGFSQFSSKSLVSGTFVNRNHFAGYLEMVIPLTFGILFACLGERSSSPLKKFVHLFEEKYLKTLLILFLIFVMIGAHLLTGSRGGMISFSLGILFLCLLAYTRRLFRRWVIVVLIFVLLVLGIGVMTSPDEILARLGALAKPETEQSFQLRWEVWKSALRLFRDFPIIGSGLGTFSHIFRRYQNFPSDLFFTHAENDYLQLLTEAGIVGTSLMLWFGFALFYRIIKAWKQQRSRWAIAIAAGGLSAMFSIAIHSSVDFNLHIPSNALLFSVIAGLSYAAAYAQRTEAEKSRSSEVKKRRRTKSNPQQPATSNQQPATSNQQPATSNQQPATSNQQPAFNLRRSTYYMIAILAFGLVLFYLFRVTQSHYAFLCHQQALDTASLIKGGYVSAENPTLVTNHIQKAIRSDRNNARYYHALGSYLHQYYIDIHPPETPELQKQGLHEAETWLQKAVVRNPANPWYYYDLGRLSFDRGDCPIEQDGRHLKGDAPLSSCPTARYFLAALENAPGNFFLQKNIGSWYYHYNPEMAFQLISKIIYRNTPNSPGSQNAALERAKFLYDIHSDYHSDLEANQILYSSISESQGCKAGVDLQYVLQRSPDNSSIELGNDDGSAEWRVRLTSKTDRVKKVICLPESLENYKYAALKILMSNGGSADFTAHIYINEQQIKQYNHTVPRITQWQEIPFDKDLLQGKTSINMYIRVTGASAQGDFLQILGDQDTPTTHSVLNFDTRDDLSSADGIQTGEYMIRLVLRKE